MLRRLTHMALVLASFAAVAQSVTPADARSAQRHAAMILDANTGAVLHNDDGDELRHPASLTKMMTLYLTFETIESGRLKLTDRVPISDAAASAAPSSLELKEGEDIAVQDAIKALITKSANDVAIALAEKIGGSEKNFVRLMNARAKDIGMTKTNFENASGLPDNDQVTTARDMITLGLRLQDDYPKYYPLFALQSFTYDGHTHRNHNTLMNHFAGIDGIKTGYTSASGFNLVSSFHRGGRHLVGAVFGGDSAGERNAEMRNLLTRTFNRASSNKTRKAPPSPLIAALKLKAEPKLAERPAKPKPNPVVVAQAAPAPAKPAPAPIAKAPPATVPGPASTPAAEASAAPAPQTPPVAVAETRAEPLVAVQQLEMAKVKHVSMSDAQAAHRPKPRPDETTDMPEETAAANDAASLMATPADRATATDPVASALAASDPSAETIVPKIASAAPAVLPSALDNGERAMLGAANRVEPTSAPVETATATPAPVVATPAPPKPKPAAKTKDSAAQIPAPSQRGLPPSTLQSQAAAFKVASAQPSPSGRYEIQIGAYGSIDEAQKSLATVQNRAGALLQNSPSVTHPVKAGGKQMFRARFAGFDSAGATRACNELRRQAVDCFVMTAE